MFFGSFLRRPEGGRLLPLHSYLKRATGLLAVDPKDYEELLEGLSESREHLRVMEVSGEQQAVNLTRAFYRIDLAAAAIRHLLDQAGQR